MEKKTNDEQKENRPRCTCGAYCWAYAVDENASPCMGEVSAVEEYPGHYIHYCEAHGNPFDE